MKITDQDVRQGAALFLARIIERSPGSLVEASELVERRLQEWGIRPVAIPPAGSTRV